MRSSAITTLALTLLALFPRPGLASGPIVTSDLLRIRSVSSIDVAPSGMAAVFAVQSIAPVVHDAEPAAEADVEKDRDHSAEAGKKKRPRYEYRSHLFLVDLDRPDAPPRQLTFGRRKDHSPRFAPDGRRIVFLRDGADTENGRRIAQAWVMSIDGGEARQVTALEHGVNAPRWSPDGRLLLVTSPVDLDKIDGAPSWPFERPARTWQDEKALREAGEQRRAGSGRSDSAGGGGADDTSFSPDGSGDDVRAWLAENAQQQNPAVITRLNFQDEQSLRGAWRFDHVFIVDPDAEGEATDAGRAAPAPRRVTNGFFDHRDAVFMPDGKRIVYAARKSAEQHPDRVLGADLWQINVDGSSDQPLLLLPGWGLAQPQPSPDGAMLAFLGQQLDEPAFRQRRLGLTSATGPAPDRAEEAANRDASAAHPAPPAAAAPPAAPSPPAPPAPPVPPVAWLTGDSFDASATDFRWTPANVGVIFSAPWRGGFPLMTINSGLIDPATLVGGGDGQAVGVHAFAAGGGAIVYAVTTAGNPCVLMLRDARGERRLMDLNPWLTEKDLSVPREFWITRPDGAKVQCWLMEPTPRITGRKYPLALEIHGGPSAMWGPGEFTMWQEFQLLCAQGYGVVYANPRGSGGYGYAFQKGNFQNWGEGPAGDVLAAVDDAVARHDWIDRNKLVVTGGSYGGYLTAWIVTQDTRFKAAVAQRGVYDLDTFFGEGNAWRLVEWAFGGPPFDPRVRELIQRQSPFNHVQRIRTPLLIMHSSNDLRTGVSQSEMLYRALKSLSRPVEYVRYPDSGHDLSRTGDPSQRMDRLNRIIEFFDRYASAPRNQPRSAPAASPQPTAKP